MTAIPDPNPIYPCGACGHGPWGGHSEEQQEICLVTVVDRWRRNELSIPYSSKGITTEDVIAVLLGLKK